MSLSPLEQNLLAVLALSKGTVVSTEKIIYCLWGDRHPASPRSRVQGLVSSLRRKVGEPLVTRHPGYLFEADGTAVDLEACELLARQARLAGSPDEAATFLRQALALWRGEPLAGVSAPGIEFDRIRLAELRVGLLEERIAADLELGQHATLVSELTVMVSAHPLRERFAGQLMHALYRCNRQADALKVYQALRERLADELGSDPCADVRNLHAAILRGDPVSRGADSAPDATVVRPAQLPASVGHFTGREPELAALRRATSRRGDEPSVVMVSGAVGIGKTALVVRWAHSAAEQYPDGQIFADLHGRIPDEALSAGDAVAVALGALGVAKENLPATVDERVSLYRTIMSGRRILIVADDAVALDQLLTLVPPTTASQLVATSRRRLAALDTHHAVQAVQVEPLSDTATHDLLANILGPARLREAAASALVRWCGGWPLAIRLAGARLAARPWQSMASFVDDLDALTDLVLDEDPRSVRAALVAAHAALSPSAAYLFGRLGLYPPSSLNLRGPAKEMDASTRRVRMLLDELVAAHLIVQTGPDRYHIHSVVHRFARHCGAELADRDAVDALVRDRGALVPDGLGRMADSYRI